MTQDQGGTEEEVLRVMRGMWLMHLAKAKASLDSARRLREMEFLSPAFVWAVRSVEIFVRECLLLPSFYEELADTEAAFDAANRLLGTGHWDRALREAVRRYGLIEEALTDDDRNAWNHWRKSAGTLRGQIVHGHLDPDPDQVDWVIAYSERVMSWWAQHLAVEDRGPLRGILREVLAMLPLAPTAEGAP